MSTLGLQLELAWRSLLRTPVFSAVMVAALGLGVSGWLIQFATFQRLARRLQDDRPDLLSVALSRPEPAGLPPGPAAVILSAMPATLLSWRDAERVLASPSVVHATATFAAPAVAVAADGRQTTVRTRYATRDLFALFEIPFVEGGPWSAAADAGSVDEVVLTEAGARRLLGAGPFAGRTARIEGWDFRVAGVIAGSWDEAQRLYDFETWTEPAEEVHLPLALVPRLRAWPMLIVERGASTATTDLRTTDHGALHVWVRVADATARRELERELAGTLEADRAAGRVDAPTGVTLRTPAEWRASVLHVGGGAAAWPIIVYLFLGMCGLNLARLVLARSGLRARDLAVMRAFGARRSSVVSNLLLEAALIGLCGGVVAVAIAVALQPSAVRSFPARLEIEGISVPQALAGLGVAVALALGCALVPAWRAARRPPAVDLRSR